MYHALVVRNHLLQLRPTGWHLKTLWPRNQGCGPRIGPTTLTLAEAITIARERTCIQKP
jgi:hypothetical protein